jgi:hypothetical protein
MLACCASALDGRRRVDSLEQPANLIIVDNEGNMIQFIAR